MNSGNLPKVCPVKKLTVHINFGCQGFISLVQNDSAGVLGNSFVFIFTATHDLQTKSSNSFLLGKLHFPPSCSLACSMAVQFV
jgi:hypothetical protein